MKTLRECFLTLLLIVFAVAAPNLQAQSLPSIPSGDAIAARFAADEFNTEYKLSDEAAKLLLWKIAFPVSYMHPTRLPGFASSGPRILSASTRFDHPRSVHSS